MAGLLCLGLAACGKDQAETPGQAPANTAGTAADVNDPVSIGLEAITETAYRRHIEILASDEFGGRAPGSPGEDLTVAYLIDHFQNLGLEPANGERFTQDVPLMLVDATNKPVLTISGAGPEPTSLQYGPDMMIWTRQQLPAVELQDSEMVFVGYGINAPERGWNDYAGVDVAGKTVVMLVNDPGYATQDPALFNGNAMTYYGRWDYKFDEAARQGAAGAIIIHDTKPAAYGWPTVENSWSGPQFDMVLPDQGSGLAAVEGWMHLDQARELFAAIDMDLGHLYMQAKTPGFTALPMGITASARIENSLREINTQNVAALLPGSEASDEVFIYMAHWDHLGTDPNLEGDQIYNGAMDNASGTAALLELATAYASLPVAPRRSVMFLALAAEEQGLLGSRYYALNPLHPLADTVGGLNMDGMNNIGETRDITVVGLGMSDLDDYLQAAAAAQERVLSGDREAEKGFYYRSDHFELAKEGVPMLYPKRGYDNREKGIGYGLEKAEEWTRDHYHRVSDEYDLSWDVSGALEDIEVFFTTGLDVANSDDWPNWKEGTEFKAKRDAQRPR
jgi:Zn-dependent M28 family amino/carboxypeptidase